MLCRCFENRAVPIELSELKTRAGHPVLRVNFEGEVSVLEAEAFLVKVSRGGPMFGHGILVVGNISGLTAQVRKVLTSEKSRPTNPPPVAIMVLSAMTRMVAGLAMRLSQNENTDFFNSEPEAMTWLEGRMETFIAKGGIDAA